MWFARRLGAALMALLLALVPLSMERCRTACSTGSGAAGPSTAPAHPCHETSPDRDGGRRSRVDSQSRACGHNDEARTSEAASLAATTGRILALTPGLVPLAPGVRAGAAWTRGDWLPHRLRLPRPSIPLDSPLRV